MSLKNQHNQKLNKYINECQHMIIKKNYHEFGIES